MMRNADDHRTDYDKPPCSRLFIVCGKNNTKEDLKSAFQKYGEIEDIYMPKDRNSGTHRGIAYVKYNKTSSAAAAIQNLHMKSLNPDGKPIKVMVSSNKGDGSYSHDERCMRLFIKVQRNASENEIREHFSKFGEVTSIHLQKDKSGSDQCRGFAYVNFSTFLDTAKAFEECDPKYRAIFATPREELKRPLIPDRFDIGSQNNSRNFPKHDFDSRESISNMLSAKSLGFDTISVTCSPGVPQKCIEQLLKIIPRVVSLQYKAEYNECNMIVKYDTEVAAAHVLESLNHYQFPSGELITIKPYNSSLHQAANNLTNILNTFKTAKDSSPDMIQLAEAIAQASSLIQAATSKEQHPESSNDFEYLYGVKVPLVKPLADKNSKLAKRCFIVMKPTPPPHHILKTLFCRFGDLIDVSVVPNKTFGFVKYASERAAEQAIISLHGATLYGITFKVMEADDRPPRDDKITIDEDAGADHDMESKRAKVGE